MFIIYGTIEVRPDQRDELLAASIPMSIASRAEEGCYEYAFTADTEVPGRVRVIERWEAHENLVSHFTTPHMGDFQKVLRSLEVKGSDVSRYEVSGVGPVFPPDQEARPG